MTRETQAIQDDIAYMRSLAHEGRHAPLLAGPILVTAAIVFGGALTGVVVIERQGIGRAFALVNRRFWPTAGRLLLAVVAAVAYSAIIGLLVGLVADPHTFVSSVLSSVLLLPLSLAAVGVGVVTYAELRHHENPSVGSSALAAQMEG